MAAPEEGSLDIDHIYLSVDKACQQQKKSAESHQVISGTCCVPLHSNRLQTPVPKVQLKIDFLLSHLNQIRKSKCSCHMTITAKQGCNLSFAKSMIKNHKGSLILLR